MTDPAPTPSPPPASRTTVIPQPRITGRQIVEGVVDVIAILTVFGLAWKYERILNLALFLIALLAGVRVRDLLNGLGGNGGNGNGSGGGSGGSISGLLPLALAVGRALTSNHVSRVARLVVVGFAIASCSGTHVHTEAVTLDGISRASEIAEPRVVAEFEREGNDAVTAACCSHAAMTAALAAVERRWAPVVAAWEATRIAHSRYRGFVMQCQQAPALLDGGTCGIPGYAEAAADFLHDLTAARCTLIAIGRHDLDAIPGPLECGGDGGAS